MQINLNALRVRPAIKSEEVRYRELMQHHHYLGDLAKIGHTLWYVATHGEEWAALLSFSASAWKCGARDRWIGWDFRHQYDRLNLIANNSRFLILPEWHYPNLGSKALSLCHQRLSVVLAIAAGATLCGMRGYKAIAAWAKDLKPKARERFGCRRENKKCVVPSEFIIRDVLVRVDPVKLDLALQQWNATFAKEDQSLAIDGKTMRNAIDGAGRQTHIPKSFWPGTRMSVAGHETALCYTQKKLARCP